MGLHIFQTLQEAQFARQYARDHLLSSVPSYPVYILDKTKTKFDPLRGDFTGSRVFFDPVDIPLWIDPQPKEKLLEQYGLNENRDLVVNANIDWLEEKGLKIESGAVIIYNNEEYDVKEVEEDDWVGSGDKPMKLTLFMDLRRPSSTSDNRVDVPEGQLPNTSAGPVIPADTVVDGTTERGDPKADESDIIIFDTE